MGQHMELLSFFLFMSRIISSMMPRSCLFSDSSSSVFWLFHLLTVFPILSIDCSSYS